MRTKRAQKNAMPRCHYCGRSLQRVNPKSPTFATLDHVIPKSRGGTSRRLNLVDCCRHCNTEKANMTGGEYWAWVLAGRPNKREHLKKLGLSTEQKAEQPPRAWDWEDA